MRPPVPLADGSLAGVAGVSPPGCAGIPRLEGTPDGTEGHTPDDEKTVEKKGEAAPSAQNPDDTQPHEGKHSPEEAKGVASDGDGASG